MIDERKQPNDARNSRSYATWQSAGLQPSRAPKQPKTYPHKASLVFFGNERLATGVTTDAPTLRALLQEGYHVVAVISNYEEARSRIARPLEIAAIAREHDIPVLLPGRLIGIKDQLADYQVAAGILVAYGQIVPQEIIELFPRGIVNIHPSLLPLGRGPTPIERTILAGSAKTGVSIMQLTKEMDAGPVYAQKELPLSGQEGKQELADSLLHIGSELLLEQLPRILDGSTTPIPQDPAQAAYCSLLTKADGRVDWAKPAEQIEREVRAYMGWPSSYTTLNGKDVKILEAEVVKYHSTQPGLVCDVAGELHVECAQDSLKILRLQVAGKKPITGAEFIRGYRL